MSYPTYDLTVEQIMNGSFETNKGKGFLCTPARNSHRSLSFRNFGGVGGD